MFDFRYHALSLVAVFLALTVGVLLGVAIGDRGLVSSAESDIRSSLRGDVRDAQAQAAELRAELEARRRFEDEVYPTLVGGQLPERRIGLLFLGDSSDRVVGLVKDALEQTGARVVAALVAREPLDRAALAGRAEGTRYAALDADDDLLEPFGRRIGAQLIGGGRLVRRVRRALFPSASGRLQRLDAVVVVRDPPDLEGDEASAARAFEDGLLAGLTANDAPVVGVELSSTSPTQIGWYKDHEIASVDDLDDIAGRAALVFALAGADGHFGVKRSAEALLPRVVGGEQP